MIHIGRQCCIPLLKSGKGKPLFMTLQILNTHKCLQVLLAGYTLRISVVAVVKNIKGVLNIRVFPILC